MVLQTHCDKKVTTIRVIIKTFVEEESKFCLKGQASIKKECFREIERAVLRVSGIQRKQPLKDVS